MTPIRKPKVANPTGKNGTYKGMASMPKKMPMKAMPKKAMR